MNFPLLLSIGYGVLVVLVVFQVMRTWRILIATFKRLDEKLQNTQRLLEPKDNVGLPKCFTVDNVSSGVASIVSLELDGLEHSEQSVAVIRHAISALGSKANAARWLQTPSAELGAITPLEALLCGDEKRVRKVDDLLTCMEYGTYS